MRRSVKALAAAGALAGGLMLVQPTSATAAVDPAGVCGSGYRVIDSQALKSGSLTLATVYLTYNSGNGYNCVVTTLAHPNGARYYLKATLQASGGSQKVDSGEFKSYAGPVYVSATDKCVKWGGQFDTDPGFKYTSPFEHCG